MVVSIKVAKIYEYMNSICFCINDSVLYVLYYDIYMLFTLLNNLTFLVFDNFRSVVGRENKKFIYNY